MHALRFVLNLPVVGLPSDRQERMLRFILQNKRQMLRLLLLLLANSSRDVLAALTDAHRTSDDDPNNKRPYYLGDLTLFEPLLKTLEHNPNKLSRVARLISDLEKTPGGADLLPAGFLDVWVPIWTMAQRLINEQNKR
jgi:hypothetical protein